MRALSVAVLGLALVVTPALARQAHRYDPAAEVTLTGVVVDYHESKKANDHPGLHFTLQIGSAAAEGTGEAEPAPEDVETVEVHACPVKLLSQLDFPVDKGDELTVTGSRPGGGSVLIARELKKGTVTLQLRDEKGVPIWTDLP